MSVKLPSFREKLAKTVNLHHKDEDDECDRIPSNVVVTPFDLACYFFAICTYVFDIFMDIWVSVFYFRKGNEVAGILTAAFILVPSMMLNMISVLFWIDDEERKQTDDHADGRNTFEFVFSENIKVFNKAKNKTSIGIEVTDSGTQTTSRKRRIFKWICAAVLQIGPLLWYFTSLKHALRCYTLQKRSRKERMYHQTVFFKKVEADRDAGILRFFEACLESMPQLLIQGYFLFKDWQNYGHTNAEFLWRWRCLSIVFSLVSISYSFVSHHRVLRISLPQKQNLNPTGCYIMFLWRFFTIAARFLALTSILVVNQLAGILLIVFHVLISTLSLYIFQRVDTKAKSKFIDPVMFIINIWIHIFSPFNMSEGRSRFRYSIQYGLEIIEGLIVIGLVNFYFKTVIPFADRILAGMGTFYTIGLVFMVVYHMCVHPNMKTKVIFRHINPNKV